MDIIEISNKFPNELDAIKHFETVRWGEIKVYAYCESENLGVRQKDYRFRCKKYERTFYVTTNTYTKNKYQFNRKFLGNNQKRNN